MSLTPESDPTEAPLGLPANTEQRVDELWFADGTLIVQAGKSLFRVYGGILARESPIFHDMLAIPQPNDAETMDGCNVVRLTDDAWDLKCFLKAIFDYKSVDYVRRSASLTDHITPDIFSPSRTKPTLIRSPGYFVSVEVPG
jgi:hypothetical protein